LVISHSDFGATFFAPATVFTLLSGPISFFFLSDHIVVLVLFPWVPSILFSIMLVLNCISTNSI
jgi:hypothetical protein